jgi:hypothetical protein
MVLQSAKRWISNPIIVRPNLVFQESDLEPFKLPGTATITGQAFLRIQSGEVKFGAGCEVFLWPATPYLEERFDLIYRDLPAKSRIYLHEIAPMEPEVEKQVNASERSTIADASGYFEFKNLPAGRYLLRCTIEWRVNYSPAAMALNVGYSGATAFAKAEVREGETVKVILTR